MTHLRRVADVAEEADEPGAGIVSGIVVASDRVVLPILLFHRVQ
jgi:hypothetical protein